MFKCANCGNEADEQGVCCDAQMDQKCETCGNAMSKCACGSGLPRHGGGDQDSV